ncbi:MAG: helix-turn-helix domain-containing protein [Polyangiales bacterium]
MKTRLGQRLRRLRHAVGLTQQEAAERTGMHIVQVSNIETGKQNVTIGCLVALAKAYGVEMVDLFSKTVRDFSPPDSDLPRHAAPTPRKSPKRPPLRRSKT